MALEAPVLDDLRWSQLVDAARRRIAAVSGGRWTLHAPVDPGMTLLELYAWLHEQRLFWMDQRTPALDRRLLALLGVTPRPDLPAATVLCVPEGTVAAGDAFELADGFSPVVWTADEDLSALHLASDIGLWVGGTDRSADLGQRAVRLLPPRSAGAFQLTLELAEPPAPGGTMAFLIELFDDASVSPDLAVAGVERRPRASRGLAPSWAPPEADDRVGYEPEPQVPPPAQLRWFYSKGLDFKSFSTVEDGTGGLRRSGLVRLPIPADWTPVHEVGARYAIRVEVAAGHTAPPRLLRLLPNAVRVRDRAVHPLSRREAWLPLGGARFTLPHVKRLRLEPVEARLDGATWTPTTDLAIEGPDRPVFEVDRSAGELRFGNGLLGRQPRGPVLCEVTFETGGGLAGNLPPGSRWRRRGQAPVEAVMACEPNPEEATVTNPVAAEGGAEPESLEEARVRALREQRRQERAVTAPDFEHLALTTPGVAIRRAHAAVGHHPSLVCGGFMPGVVSVFVVPDAPRDRLADDWHAHAWVPDPMPDSGMVAAVLARLESRRLVGTRVFVQPPRYQDVRLRFRLTADARHAPVVRADLLRRMLAWLDPLTGGPEGTGWPFGGPLIQSALMEQAAEILGNRATVEGVSITVWTGTTSQTDACNAVPIGSHALPRLIGVTADIHPRTERPGGMR